MLVEQLAYHGRVSLAVVFIDVGDLHLGHIVGWAAGEGDAAHPQHTQPQGQRDQGHKRDPAAEEDREGHSQKYAYLIYVQ